MYPPEGKLNQNVLLKSKIKNKQTYPSQTEADIRTWNGRQIKDGENPILCGP